MTVKIKMDFNNISMEPKVTNLDNCVFKYQSNKDFYFENGQSIPSLELQYETYGTLNNSKSNVILIHHSLSVGANVRNWWGNFIGENKILDPNKYFIICINNLGSCFGSSGPSLNTINPKTNKPYLKDFPEFTFKDIVNSQLELLEYLNIDKIHAVIGSSMGGMISLSLLEMKPEIVNNIFLCATAYKAYPFNIANRMVQKEIIIKNQEYQNGYYTNNPSNAIKLARKLGLLFYRGIPELNERFYDNSLSNIENIYNFYEYNADKFCKIFDANSYVYTLNCMDNFEIKFKAHNTKNNKTKIFIIGIDSDILFPLYQQKELYLELQKTYKNITFVEHKTLYGHDSFFIETQEYSNYLQDFLK